MYLFLTVLMLPVYDLIEDEVGQFAVHIFKFFMSLFLWGDAVAVLLALCLLPALAGGPYKIKHDNKV